MNPIYKKLKAITFIAIIGMMAYTLFKLNIWNILSSTGYTTIALIGVFAIPFFFISFLSSDAGIKMIRGFYGLFIKFEDVKVDVMERESRKERSNIFAEVKSAIMDREIITTAPEYVIHCYGCGAPRSKNASCCDYCKSSLAVTSKDNSQNG